MPQNTLFGIDTPFCCSRKTHTTAEQKPYAVCHYHDAYEMFLFLNGKASMYYDEEYHPMNPGDLYIIPPDVPHGAACYDSKVYDRVVVNVREELLRDLSTGVTDLSVFLSENTEGKIKVVNLNTKAQKRLIQMVEEMPHEEEDGKPSFGHDIEIRARAALLLVELNRLVSEFHAQSGKKSRPKLVENIVDYIAEHLTESITLEILANQFFISSKYISSVFHKSMGMTLREYIITKRVEYAKKLLSEGKNVSEACELSGFGDYSNFIRTFTLIAGISPGKYARQQANEE